MRRQPSFTRADRLEHLLLDEVDRLLSYEVRSPLAQQVKVVGGHLSPDLGHLRVNYILHDGSDTFPALQEVLEKAETFLARALQEALQLRGKPKIAFHYDRDAERARRVDQLLLEDRLKHPPVAPIAEALAETAGPESGVAEPVSGVAEPAAKDPA